MKCTDIAKRLEILAPVKYAESYDNVGLIAGRSTKDIKKVYLAVDATDEVIEEAIDWEADLLLTHHPLIFSPLKRLTEENFIGRRVVRLLQADLCYYAMHTNFDIMCMADAAADELMLQNSQVLQVTYEDELSKEGIGRYGMLPRTMTLSECAEFVKDIFRLPAVRVYGELKDKVEIAAISPGSAKSVIPYAVQTGVDVLISGDIDHHMGIDLVSQGVSVIDAGHYGLEKLFVPFMKDYFLRNLPEVKVETTEEKSPYIVI
ncbi:MAG TPA: Nif3-like dinuclear metal center hexameric protein [Lachnospiraceae bacterium]|nr:Nif3-like dinuclear metal center hexameric protein [Lachnospiraceae bacterium]